MIVVINHVDRVYAARCSRIPEGSGGKRSQSTGNFRVRLSDDSSVYTPGKQYTGKFEIDLYLDFKTFSNIFRFLPIITNRNLNFEKPFHSNWNGIIGVNFSN